MDWHLLWAPEKTRVFRRIHRGREIVEVRVETALLESKLIGALRPVRPGGQRGTLLAEWQRLNSLKGRAAKEQS